VPRVRTMTEAKKRESIALSASKPVWSLIGTLCAVLFMGFTWWLNDVNADQDVLAADIKAVEETVGKDSERLQRVETKIEGIEKGQERIEGNIQGVDGKLDRLLERSL